MKPPSDGDVGAVIVLAVMAGVFLAVVLLATGCTHERPDVTTANVVRLAGHEGAELLREHCREPAERAAELPQAEAQRELLRLERLGCRKAGRAHDVLVTAHEVLHAASEARSAGECVGVSAGAAKCDVIGASARLVRAGVDFAHAIDAVRQEAAR